MSHQDARRLSKQDLDLLFSDLGEQLKKEQQTVDIAVYGGSALVLLFDFRKDTGDVDAIWRGGDSKAFTSAVKTAANRYQLPEDWLNDGVSMFIAGNEKFLMARAYPSVEEQHLRVFTASPEYVLAMKIVSMRDPWNSFADDRPDIKNILVEMKISDYNEIMSIVKSFYPEDIPSRNEAILKKDIIPAVIEELETGFEVFIR